MIHTTFGSIILNEAEYIEANIRQHVAHCDRWVIVEGADRRYPSTRVSSDGLSTDGTAEIAERLAAEFPQIVFVQHGWADDKSELRNRYAELAADGVLIVFDADEFLTHQSLEVLKARCANLRGPGSVRIPHVHFWHDTTQIITGGYYDIPHDRAYQWLKGCRYLDNHNNPHLPDGTALQHANYQRHDRELVPVRGGWTHQGPAWLHFGFVKDARNIADKNAYYLNRGEATTRPGTTRDRRAWFEDELPPGCQLHRWLGPWPEIMAQRVAA